MPKDLATLSYRAVLVELPAGENVTELHGFVLRLLAGGVPVVLCGPEAEQAMVRQNLAVCLADEGLQTADVALYTPSRTVADKYRFRAQKLTVLTVGPLKFKVCKILSLCDLFFVGSSPQCDIQFTRNYVKNEICW